MLELKLKEEAIRDKKQQKYLIEDLIAQKTKLVSELYKLHTELKNKEKPTFRFSQTLARISDLEAVFLRPGRTEEEKKKLLDLLQCEWNEEI